MTESFHDELTTREAIAAMLCEAGHDPATVEGLLQRLVEEILASTQARVLVFRHLDAWLERLEAQMDTRVTNITRQEETL